MMARAALLLAWAAILLPAQGVLLWKKDTDYMDFTIMKSCFGEEVAVPLERFTYSVGQYCEESEGTSVSSIPAEFTGDRKKRSLMKLPEDPAAGVVVCNLRKMGLLRTNNEVDYAMVEELMLKIPINAGLKGNMLDVLTSCRINQLQLPELLPEDPDNALVMALIAIGNYFSCVINGGVEACKSFEMQRYFSGFQ